VSHIYFVKARNAQGVDPASLRYKSPFGLWGTYIALGFCCLIALTKNFAVFTKGDYGNFDYKNFIVSTTSPRTFLHHPKHRIIYASTIVPVRGTSFIGTQRNSISTSRRSSLDILYHPKQKFIDAATIVSAMDTSG
jgi:amino acid permease